MMKKSLKKSIKAKKQKEQALVAAQPDILDIIHAREIRTEYITSGREKSLEELAEAYNAPIDAIRQLATKEKWDIEKKTYRANEIQEMKGELLFQRAKSELNSVINSAKLQDQVYNAISKNIAEGQYFPTIKDFATLNDIVKDKSGEKQTGSSNKILNIVMNKDPSKMNYQELQALENDINGMIRDEE
ncbi:MAG: hypothetical protein M0R38_10965 [Bacteroidia bacterium]|nr:hypothetical protein [Bacteroidia bacterium]